MEAIRIVVADEHPIMREGLKSVINQTPDMCVVGEAFNKESAVAQVQKYLPGIVLMDLCLRHSEGLAAVRAIRAASSATRIIVLTAYAGEEDIYRALRAGARGYLLKIVTPQEILAAIRTVGQGRKYLLPEVAATLAQRSLGQELTTREYDVLDQIGHGKSNKEAARDLSISEGTVKFHVANILVKLGSSDRTQAVVTAVERGIIRI